MSASKNTVTAMTRGLTLIVAIGIGVMVARSDVAGQRRGGGPGIPRTPRAMAPIDLTGYWVSVVSEDYRWRMVTPPKGDVSSIPLNPQGRRAAEAWDLAKDTADGNQCKAFGVGGIMRQPGRLHITWQDDNTLKVDFDAGTQTRLLHFGASAPPAGDATWQGYSTADWEGPALVRTEAPPGPGAGPAGPPVPGGGGQGLRGGPPPPNRATTIGGALKVLTSRMREGYLRKNGVPYSENATMTEYFH